MLTFTDFFKNLKKKLRKTNDTFTSIYKYLLQSKIYLDKTI